MTDTQKNKREKRVVKLTAKALIERLKRLQSDRKAKLNKASNLRKKIQQLKQTGDTKSEVKCALDDLVKLCDEANCIHGSLMGLLPDDERENHKVPFQANIFCNNDLQGRTGHRGYWGNPRWADGVGMVQNIGPLLSLTFPLTSLASHTIPYYTA